MENNLSAAKQNIRSKMTLENLFNSTSVFNYHKDGGQPLDKDTIEYVKNRFSIWFESWIEEDLKLLTS